MSMDREIVKWIRATPDEEIRLLVEPLTSSGTTTATMRVVENVRYAHEQGQDVRWPRSMGKTIYALLRRATDLHAAIVSSEPSPRQAYALLMAGWRDGASGLPARQPHARSASYARGHADGARALREASAQFAGDSKLDLSQLALDIICGGQLGPAGASDGAS
jgi:hypothetical protein